MDQLRGPFRSRTFWELYFSSTAEGLEKQDRLPTAAGLAWHFLQLPRAELNSSLCFQRELNRQGTNSLQSCSHVWKLIGSGKLGLLSNGCLKSSWTSRLVDFTARTPCHSIFSWTFCALPWMGTGGLQGAKELYWLLPGMIWGMNVHI